MQHVISRLRQSVGALLSHLRETFVRISATECFPVSLFSPGFLCDPLALFAQPASIAPPPNPLHCAFASRHDAMTGIPSGTPEQAAPYTKFDKGHGKNMKSVHIIKATVRQRICAQIPAPIYNWSPLGGTCFDNLLGPPPSPPFLAATF